MPKWRTEPLPIHGSRIVDLEGRVIATNIYDDDIAAQIVREHNAHEAMVEAIESRAADAAIHAGLGVSEWPAFLTEKETLALALANKESE